MQVAVIPNLEKKDAGTYTEKIIAFLKARGAVVLMHEKHSGAFRDAVFCESHSELAKACDLIVAVGGDGTIIHSARHAAQYEKPILGVNLGRLGFLAALEKDEIESLQKLFTGDYKVQSLMMLEIRVENAAGEVRIYTALNDAVLSGALSKILDFDFSVDGFAAHHYRADGLILATPTGSTAYSLSAGGPVVDYETEGILFTPICPHSLFNRSTVFAADKVLAVSPDNTYDGDIYLTIDGDSPIPIHRMDKISVRRSGLRTRLVKMDDRCFYDIVNRKILHNGY